jgi:hypothetical protein
MFWIRCSRKSQTEADQSAPAGAGEWRPESPGQRDRTAGAQFRTLDARLRVDLAVRATRPRHRRLAAEQAGPPCPGHHDQPDRGDINSYEHS